MNKIICFVMLCITLTSCNNQSKQGATQALNEKLEPVVDIKELTGDYMTWWSYHYYNISLASDFEALDENFKAVSKGKFLESLTSGKFIAVEMKTEDTRIYKLYELPKGVEKSISKTISSTAGIHLKYYQMEGHEFPEIDIVDLEGNSYNNEDLKGKITVFKTWFINCKPCIEEMPELNRLVSKYENNENIQFLSLALDKKEPLQEFLKKKEFKYAVIADQKELIVNQLNLRAYPRHIIVDENGRFKKVLETAPELISYLENEKSVTKKPTKINLPVPPPSEPIGNTKKSEG
ncbi:TlpA family protein disulfide reductase [Christiangramia aquimixticola]|uniref:TlpA family protein disulfide reductase n=1 Tax=Christiangramia aquimixticola TaxID=1697558 RepID=UPI003AA81E08